jgi:hypothetical protein
MSQSFAWAASKGEGNRTVAAARTSNVRIQSTAEEKEASKKEKNYIFDNGADGKADLLTRMNDNLVLHSMITYVLDAHKIGCALDLSSSIHYNGNTWESQAFCAEQSIKDNAGSFSDFKKRIILKVRFTVDEKNIFERALGITVLRGDKDNGTLIKK